MSFTEIRPRFKRKTQLPEAEILVRISSALEEKKPAVEFRSAHGWIYFSIPKDDQHIWSPRLSVEFDEGDEENLLHATFGPNPNVWTLFIFIYSFLGFAAMIVFIIGGKSDEFGSLCEHPLVDSSFNSHYWAGIFFCTNRAKSGERSDVDAV